MTTLVAAFPRCKRFTEAEWRRDVLYPSDLEMLNPHFRGHLGIIIYKESISL